jgi:hypothetical protein
MELDMGLCKRTGINRAQILQKKIGELFNSNQVIVTIVSETLFNAKYYLNNKEFELFCIIPKDENNK